MLLIPCPWCGQRPESEFTHGGDATLEMPDLGADRQAWFDYVYPRANPRGPHEELWYHGAGCGKWLRVRRDTLTHEVLASAPPAGPGGDETP
jgi:sarcosine oxidase subunit delta